MEAERNHMLELRDERNVAASDEFPDGDVIKRKKQSSPEAERNHLPGLEEDRASIVSDDAADTDTAKRKKQLTEEDVLKPSEGSLGSPRSVKQLRKSWESIKTKAKRAQASYTRQRFKSLGCSPAKPDSETSKALHVFAGDGGSDLAPGLQGCNGGLLNRALSAPASDPNFPSAARHEESDHDMLDHMSDNEVSDDEMSDHAMSDRDISDSEMANNVLSDQDMSDPEGPDRPVKHDLADKLLNLKLMHYENLVRDEQQGHELGIRVKRAQLEAALSQKAACEEVGRAAVAVQESVRSVCQKWELTAESLQKAAEVFLQRNGNHYYDTNMND